MSRASAKRGLPERVKMRHDTHFVEALAERAGETPLGRMVALSAVEPDPNQPRTAMGDLGELARSIEEKGVLEPILVRPRPSTDLPRSKALYLIISGERRYRAAMEAGLAEIPVIEMDVGPEEALEIALVENLQRKDLTPFEEAEGFRALAERFDYTHEQIAAAVGKARTVVTESMALLQIPPNVREAAQALGIHSKSLLLEVLKADDEDEMLGLIEEVGRRGLSRDDLRRQKRRGDKGKSPRRKPYVFSFRAPDKSFHLSLKFRQSTVSKSDLVRTLEQILDDLRRS